MEYLTVMLGRVSPLGVEVDAVVVRVPSHVIPVRNKLKLMHKNKLYKLISLIYM